MSPIQLIPLSNLLEKGEMWDPGKDSPDDTFSYIDIESIDRENKMIAGASVITGCDAPSRARQLVKAGDVLVSTVRPNLNAVAQVPDELNGATASTGFAVLRADRSQLDARYLFHWVRSPSFVHEMVRRATGASYPAVSDTTIRDSKIPLRSLDEQRRIAAILDKADAIRRKRQQVLDIADKLTQSAFLEFFGDPVTNPKRWRVMGLGQVSKIQSGVAKGRRLGGQQTVSVPYMRVANVQDGILHLEEVKTIEALHSDVERLRLLPGDILLTEGGDPDKLGRAAVWQGQIDPCIHQNHIFRVRANREIVRPDYLGDLISSPRGKRYFCRAAKQTTGIATINRSQLDAFPVLLAPIELQEEYALLKKRTQGMRRSHGRAMAEIRNLFSVLSSCMWQSDSTSGYVI